MSRSASLGWLSETGGKETFVRSGAVARPGIGLLDQGTATQTWATLHDRGVRRRLDLFAVVLERWGAEAEDARGLPNNFKSNRPHK